MQQLTSTDDGNKQRVRIQSAIARADLMLRTTLYDGDAISVREALYLGTAVVATDNGMRPAGVQLVPVSDIDALFAAVERTLGPGTKSQEKLPLPDESNLEAVLRVYEELLR